MKPSTNVSQLIRTISVHFFLTKARKELAAIFHERQAWYEGSSQSDSRCDQVKPRGNYRGTEMKIAYLGPKGSFFRIMLCRQPFPKRNCRLLPISQMSSWPMNKAWWTILWCQLKTPLKVVSMKVWITFFTRLASKQRCRNCSTHSPATDGSSRSVKIEKIFSHPQALAQGKKNSSTNTIQRLKSR